MGPRPEHILKYLADLAPTRKRSFDVVTRSSEFVYLGWQPYLLSTAIPHPAYFEDTDQTRTGFDFASTVGRDAPRKALRQLASIDALHPTEHLLRLGWLFVSGTTEIEGTDTRFCLPLLSVPVKVTTRALEIRVEHLGDIEMPDDFFDEADRADLEESADPYGGGADEPNAAVLERMPLMQEWVAKAMSGAGLPSAELTPASRNPLEVRNSAGLAVVAGAAIYTVRDVAAPNVSGGLLQWSSQALDGTAFHAMYGGDTADTTAPVLEIQSPLPLNARQREALERSHRETITVVSGPPGTGKSHLVAATAIDEVAQGRNVLIATQSEYAADVITDLLDRHPGPRYVRFGKRADRVSVAAELSDGLAVPLSERDADTLAERAGNAGRELERARSVIATLIDREAAFAAGLRRRPMLTAATSQAPGVLDEAFDLAEAGRNLARARITSGLFAGWRSGRAERNLRRQVGARPEATLDDIEMAIEAGRAETAVRRGLLGGGLSLDAAWLDLERAELEWRDTVGRKIEAVRRSRQNSKRTSTRAVAALASALRAGRVQRRRLLTELSGDDFLDVLPLWVGTLKEIDDTLPVSPGMFDVVIFDESSQIDQMRAAPALARAQRAVVVGDPRQLRHVSFTSDSAIREAASRYSISDDLARTLDVRRNSLFDAAAAAAPVTWLDEHFRSVPHIIAFSDRRFYDGSLKLMTRHPVNELTDSIRSITVRGERRSTGVNPVEVSAVVVEIARLIDRGFTSIGVITPFRAQADALEAVLVSEYSAEEVDRLGLRVGTVHAFQGNERDVVVASMTMTKDDLASSLRFVENPNLFNVLITRARTEMVIISSVSADDLPKGLLRDYLHHSERPPLPSEDNHQPDGWTAEIMSALAPYKVPATANYPVAGWTIDLALGAEEAAFGVECDVHPDGTDAHIERHLALRRAGWALTDAFQSRWLARPEAAAGILAERALERQPS